MAKERAGGEMREKKLYKVKVEEGGRSVIIRTAKTQKVKGRASN